MAVSLTGFCSAGSAEPISTFTVDLGPEVWRPRGGPRPGDLIMLHCRRPSALEGAPLGWSMADAATIWKRAGKAGEDATVTLQARGAQNWEVDLYLIPPESFTEQDGSVASPEPS